MDINKRYEEIIKFAHKVEHTEFTGADQTTFENLWKILNEYSSTQSPENILIWKAGYEVGRVVAILQTAVDIISKKREFENQREYLRSIDSDLSNIEFNTNNQYSVLENIVNQVYTCIANRNVT